MKRGRAGTHRTTGISRPGPSRPLPRLELYIIQARPASRFLERHTSGNHHFRSLVAVEKSGRGEEKDTGGSSEDSGMPKEMFDLASTKRITRRDGGGGGEKKELTLEKIGSFGDSRLPKEILDLGSTKSWITRRAFELLLPLIEEKAKSEFSIWFKAKVDGDFAEENPKREIQIDPIKEPAMDYTLSPYSDLIGFLHQQIHKLVEPSYFSTDGKPIALLWSESEKIQRNVKKLLSVSGQIEELCLLITDLKDKLSLTSSSAAVEVEEEEHRFACHRRRWESLNANKFEDLTSLSSMIFAHCAPGRMPTYAVVNPTLQILSIRVTELTHLEWPLKVYGVIAARDSLDNLRNPLFLCPRNGAQLVTQQVRMAPLFCSCSLLRAYSSSRLMTNIMLMLAGSLFALDWPVSCSCVRRPRDI